MKNSTFTFLILIASTQFIQCISGQAQSLESTLKSSLLMDTILKRGPEYKVIEPLVGKWRAQQTIFFKGSDKIMQRDTFGVERKMLGNFLFEVMQPIDSRQAGTFQRVSYLNYNRTNSRWEYVVLDTRYPLMMFSTSVEPLLVGGKSIHLYLDNFVMPPFWGSEYGGMMGKERRVIQFNSNQTINRQYWTLPGEKEFLAIEYIYFK